MATPTHEIIETCCSKKSSSQFIYLSQFDFTDSLHDFLAFLLITFVWYFLFDLDSLVCLVFHISSSSHHDSLDQEITSIDIDVY